MGRIYTKEEQRLQGIKDPILLAKRFFEDWCKAFGHPAIVGERMFDYLHALPHAFVRDTLRMYREGDVIHFECEYEVEKLRGRRVRTETYKHDFSLSELVAVPVPA